MAVDPLIILGNIISKFIYALIYLEIRRTLGYMIK